MTTFIEVGTALAEIRDSRLYRRTHSSFTAYLQERWNMGRAHGYRMIEAAQAVAVSPMGDKITSERQARELTGLSPEQATEVITKAEATGEITAASLHAARIEVEESDTAAFEAELAELIAETKSLNREFQVHDTYEEAVAVGRDLIRRIRRIRVVFARLFLRYWAEVDGYSDRSAEQLCDDGMDSFVYGALEDYDTNPHVLRAVALVNAGGVDVESIWRDIDEDAERCMKDESVRDQWEYRSRRAAYQATLFSALASEIPDALAEQ
jgi:hypothetical protein